jgi:hypothetical protein
LSGAQQQFRDEPPLEPLREHERLCVVAAHLDWAKDPEVHSPPLSRAGNRQAPRYGPAGYFIEPLNDNSHRSQGVSELGAGVITALSATMST